MNKPRMKTRTHFEQVPLSVVKKIAQEKALSSASNLVACAICGAPVELERCKINEGGRAVHEKCYVEKLALPAAHAQASRFLKPRLG
jgi:hypothetical protein